MHINWFPGFPVSALLQKLCEGYSKRRISVSRALDYTVKCKRLSSQVTVVTHSGSSIVPAYYAVFFDGERLICHNEGKSHVKAMLCPQRQP